MTKTFTWDKDAKAGMTSRQLDFESPWGFEETVARLKTLSGQEPEAYAGDKASVEFTGRFGDEVFTLYDYKGDRVLHARGRSLKRYRQEFNDGLVEALKAVEPSKYYAFEPEEYGGDTHGWPVL